MSTTPQTPKHPKAALYLQRKLFDGIARFIDLEQRIADLPTPQERGDVFEVFVEAYLSTQPLHQAKTVWPFSAIPLAIRERFALAHREVGVDGVFETHLGDYHAYQAKFRTDRPSLTWDELSTFMGLTDQIAERVVITNCDELSTVLSDRRGFYAIRGTDLDRLQPEDFEAIRNWLAGAIVEHTRKTPLPRQQDVLNAIVQTLTEHDRATVLMPCGTGKTLVALWAAERLGSKKILVLVPSLALVSQTLHEWLKETRWNNPSFLCVCSDPTVTDRADALVLHQADVDFPVTTDRDAVRTFLDRQTDGVKVIFSTYQSTRVVASGMTENTRFDFGIFDEAHKTAGHEGAQFGFALKDANLGIAKRLFMTATPRHYDVSKRDKEGEAKLVYSMDVPEAYGPVAYRLSFAQAVQEQMICGYKVLISVVTSAMVNDELLRRGAVKVEEDDVKARQVANQLSIKEAIEKYCIRKVITFHKSVAAASSFTAHGPEGIEAHVPALQAFHVNGTMASGKRDPIMRAFAEGERTLISNARCLTEGVDVPAVDMVAFLTPKRSLVDIVQATGRAMRTNENTNKTTGYVLVPLFLEQVEGETIEEAVARAQFDEVWAVLQALQEHDEVLAEIIRHMREERGRTKGYDDKAFRGRVEMLGPSLSLDSLRESITTQIIDRIGGNWDERFGALVAFKAQHGHCNVPAIYSSNPMLGHWVNSQRQEYRSGRLTQDRQSRLATLGFDWDPFEWQWEAGLKALQSFHRREGHCRVPRGHRERDYPLGNWAHSKRQDKETLTPERRERLDALGFVWDPLEVAWEDQFAALNQFLAEHGHCNVPDDWQGNPKLARWVTTQRKLRKTDWFSTERQRRLDALGFVWDVLTGQWGEGFKALQTFHQREGHCRVPRQHCEKDYRLGHWVSTQRRDKETLTPERRQRLDALGFVWDVLAGQWDEGFKALQTFHQREGHCRVPQEHRERGFPLGTWVEYQRSHKEDRLTPERWQRLDALGFVWEKAFAARWDEGFRALQAFHQREGHCRVPQEHREGDYRLGAWVGKQRAVKETLSTERQARLDALGFEWSLRASRKEGPHNKNYST
jgi:superfamily II DNA or RNA helicase